MVGDAAVGIFEREKSGCHCSCSFFSLLDSFEKGLMRGPLGTKKGFFGST
jgi:hypothetical protein